MDTKKTRRQTFEDIRDGIEKVHAALSELDRIPASELTIYEAGIIYKALQSGRLSVERSYKIIRTLNPDMD